MNYLMIAAMLLSPTLYAAEGATSPAVVSAPPAIVQQAPTSQVRPTATIEAAGTTAPAASAPAAAPAKKAVKHYATPQVRCQKYAVDPKTKKRTCVQKGVKGAAPVAPAAPAPAKH